PPALGHPRPRRANRAKRAPRQPAPKSRRHPLPLRRQRPCRRAHMGAPVRSHHRRPRPLRRPPTRDRHPGLGRYLRARRRLGAVPARPGPLSRLETPVFLLILIPLAWGYLLAARLLRESQRWLRWSLAYALGLLSFLAAVNALFHFLPLRPAVYLSLVLFLLGSALLFRLPGPRTRPSPLGPVEGPMLALLALTAFFEALFWQMQWADDAFFVPPPLLALVLPDVFPPQNPFHPTLPLVGHYGRDLAIATTSVVFGERFLAVQYFVTAANQAAAVLIV